MSHGCVVASSDLSQRECSWFKSQPFFSEYSSHNSKKHAWSVNWIWNWPCEHLCCPWDRLVTCSGRQPASHPVVARTCSISRVLELNKAGIENGCLLLLLFFLVAWTLFAYVPPGDIHTFTCTYVYSLTPQCLSENSCVQLINEETTAESSLSHLSITTLIRNHTCFRWLKCYNEWMIYR